MQLELDLEFFRFFNMKPTIKFNLFKVGLGLQWFLNIFTMEQMCMMLYYNYEALAFHTKLKTNARTCTNSVPYNLYH